ncbi:MAG: ornithine carbamoyltransferase [Anaerolineae bacterium]|jgi:ornithine carbamoyltransferase|nr:ornithine carbamoyltransferase [Anaerolineae bacterium]
MKKDFIAISDFSSEELMSILELAIDLKKQWHDGGNPPLLKGKVLGMIFQKPSLRTRVSFDMAMRHLGGDALYLSPNEIGLGQRESIADVARVLSGYVQVLMARVFSHDHILELARWSSIPVINGLSDYNHPCQAMADALTIIERLGKMKDINVVFIGDGNNVAVSMMHICAKLGANFTHSGPDGYQIDASALALGRTIAAGTNTKIRQIFNPQEAVRDADVIYTDTWTSMGQEVESEKRAKVFPPYQVNTELLKLAKPSAIVLHCLPAHRGQEITDEVADGEQSALFQQAHNRLHAQKAILVNLFQQANS